MQAKNKKVFVGVSGGVDSSVALALLKQEGCDVTGVFLKVWSPDFLPCDWREERRSAMRVCATLGVPFLTLDCEKEYKEEVVDYMIREYSAGRVPNPDIYCNKYVKFGVFLRKALELGADYIATGHYARKVESEIQYELFEAKDKNKDQSYFLYTLTQDQLKHTLFPIGHLTKPEVRKLAKRFGLPTAEKKDSQGLCFIGKVDMKEFLLHYIQKKRGNVLNAKGEIIGEHDGAVFFAIGQRHGFEITKKGSEDPRCFVVSKDLGANTITVASKDLENEIVTSVKEISIQKIHFISGEEPCFPLEVTCRIRYRQEKHRCTIKKESSKYIVHFSEFQDGVSIGQSIVLYDGEVCIGGGIIENIGK